MGCDIPERVITSLDVVKLVAVDVLMLLSLAGNVALYVSYSRRDSKLTPAQVLLRFIFGFGIVFAGFNAIGFTLDILCGEIYEKYAFCAVFGLLAHVAASGWVWLLTIASVERYTKCVKTAEYSTWFSAINTIIMLWGTILLLGVIFFAPVYGWGQYSAWRGQMSIELSYNSTELGHLGSVAAIMAYYSNTTNYERANIEGNRLAEQWLRGYRIEMASISLHQTGVYLVAHAQQRESVSCMWQMYQAGELADDATRGLEGIFPASLVQNLTYSVSLNRDEVMMYENVHLHTQEYSSCGLDFTLSRRDSYAFTIFLLLAMLAIPLTVIIFAHLKILIHSRRPRKNNDEKVSADDYTLAKIYFAAAIATVLLYLPYYVIDIIAGAGHYFSGSVHFLRNLAYFTASSSLCCAYLLTKQLPRLYEWAVIKVDRSKAPAAAGAGYAQDLAKSRMLTPSDSAGNPADLGTQLEEEIILTVGGPSASSTETQITNL